MRLTRKRLCSGHTGTFMMMVQQFGLAMMPLCLAMSSGFTSGTTSGTPSCIRKYEVLSTTTAPAFTAEGANSLLILPPAEASTSWMPLKESWVSSSTLIVLPRKVSDLPADRAEASRRSSSTGNFRSFQDLEELGAHRAGGTHDRDLDSHVPFLVRGRIED